MGETMMAKRSAHEHDEPRHHVLGHSEHQSREAARRRETEKQMAAMHRLRLRGRVSALRETVKDALLIFSTGMMKCMTDNEGVLPTVLHAEVSGTLESLLGMIFKAIKIPSAIACAIGIGVAMAEDARIAHDANALAQARHRVAISMIGAAQSWIETKQSELEASIEAMSTAELADDERAFQMRQNAYAPGVVELTPSQVQLVDDKFFLERRNLPLTGVTEAMQLASEIADTFDRNLALAMRASHPTTNEILDCYQRFLKHDAVHAAKYALGELGYEGRLAQETKDREAIRKVHV